MVGADSDTLNALLSVGSQLVLNSAARGGNIAVSVPFGTATLENLESTQGDARIGGGGYFSGPVCLQNCTFHGNTATAMSGAADPGGDGGGVALASLAVLETKEGVAIFNNRADRNGGGL